MSWKLLYEYVYVPYSQNKSACVVESKTGRFYAGVRIENISYPLTIPAVQAACAICLSEGEVPAKIYVDDSDSEQLDYWAKEFELEIIETENPPLDKLEDLFHNSDIESDPLPKLKALLDKAVIPNSDFPVSALLFTKDGYFEGVNVEVSEWTHGICAERVALAKAFAAGKTEFTRMEIHTKKGEISSPCGACRQVISELLPYHELKLHHADGTLSEHLSIDLLPFSFKSSALKK
ncbi:cytidine deaminase [Gracilimonas sp.]|uniref:cytidine deaminase n=1 Tax=Gracilimonas sp. TaxID=1974203 RepID=UPI0032EE9EED